MDRGYGIVEGSNSPVYRFLAVLLKLEEKGKSIDNKAYNDRFEITQRESSSLGTCYNC